MRNLNLRRAALAAAGAVIASLAFAGAGQSAVVKTGYYTIDAMAMGPESVSSDTQYTITGALFNAANDPACFNAAVNLPQGATVTAVTIWYTGTARFAGLLRHRFSDGEHGYVAERELANSGAQRRAVNLLFLPDADQAAAAAPTPKQKIDNARYSYAFRVCLNGLNKAAFHSARITYTYLD
jgi:hypothetical protein